MIPFIWTYADDESELHKPFDVAVVMPTLLRPTIVDALRSVFAQEAAGRIQVLVGIDVPGSDVAIIGSACADRPSNVVVQVIYPGYSTSARHGGLSQAVADGGVLRSVLTYLANSPYVAYLDDDNWWAPQHLHLLRTAIYGHDWAFALRWMVHPDTRRPVCLDTWESLGPDLGIFSGVGGFVDPNCLMIDKLACPDAVPLWTCPVRRNEQPAPADRIVFYLLRTKYRGNGTGAATAFYVINAGDDLHPYRLRRMGNAYAAAGSMP